MSDQKSQKLKFQVSFLGLNIALSPNLIGSSDADFHKDFESGLNSKIEKTPMSHLAKPLYISTGLRSKMRDRCSTFFVRSKFGARVALSAKCVAVGRSVNISSK